MIELSDEVGVSSASYSYDAYGNQIKRTSGEDNAYRFSTKEYSSLTGLIYFGARYYDPEIGRFLTKDPLGFAGGINQYIYCESDPVNWIDPWGLCKGGDSRWKWSPENWLWQIMHGHNVLIAELGEDWGSYYVRYKEAHRKEYIIAKTLGITGVESTLGSYIGGKGLILARNYAGYSLSTMEREILLKYAGVFRYTKGSALKVGTLKTTIAFTKGLSVGSFIVTTGATSYYYGLEARAKLGYWATRR